MKKDYSTKRSPSANQEIDSEFFAPEDGDHADDGVVDVDSSSSTRNFDMKVEHLYQQEKQSSTIRLTRRYC